MCDVRERRKNVQVVEADGTNRAAVRDRSLYVNALVFNAIVPTDRLGEKA